MPFRAHFPVLSTSAVLAAVVLSGCGSSEMRPSLHESERTTTYVISHDLTKRQAFDAMEIEIAKAFVSSKAITDVKQPENGRFIAKAVSGPKTMATGLYGEKMDFAEVRLNYTLDIQTEDKKASLEFSITGRVNDPGMYYGGYPQDLDWIRKEFDTLAGKLSQSVKGKIVVRPDPLPVPGKKPASTTAE